MTPTPIGKNVDRDLGHSIPITDRGQEPMTLVCVTAIDQREISAGLSSIVADARRRGAHKIVDGSDARHAIAVLKWPDWVALATWWNGGQRQWFVDGLAVRAQIVDA